MLHNGRPRLMAFGSVSNDNDWLKLGRSAQNVEHVPPLGEFAEGGYFTLTRANLICRFWQISRSIFARVNAP